MRLHGENPIHLVRVWTRDNQTGETRCGQAIEEVREIDPHSPDGDWIGPEADDICTDCLSETAKDEAQGPIREHVT